ncbi:MAG TPA: DMT family transporter [Usitatibacter sp.]|nr:DMT family transporter [Usitatibacter sp.]
MRLPFPPLVLVLALLWGSSFPMLKVAVETVPPITVTALRALLGGLILLAILGRDIPQLWRGGITLRAFTLQGIFNCVLPWLLVSWAARSIDAALVTILNSLSPIFIFLLTWAITRHEPATGRRFLGVMLGMAGVIAIIGVDALRGVGKHTLAELACVAGSLSYAIAAIVGRRFDNVSALVPAVGSTLTAAIMLVPIALVVDKPWTLAPSAASMLAVGGMAIISTAMAFVVYFRLLATVGSIAMSAQAYLRILVGVGLGMALLGERPSAGMWLGLPLVLAGVVTMTKKR